MNRKLRNTILAFSMSGVMLLVGLVAARPLPSAHGPAAAPGDVPAAVALALADDVPLDAELPAAESPGKRRGASSRDVIALPYFSFARGSRGTRS